MSGPGTPPESTTRGPRQAGQSAGARKPAAETTARGSGRAAMRLEAVRISDTLHAGGLSRAEADALAGAVACVSAASVGRWRAKVRGLAPDEWLAALTDRKPTGRPPLIAGVVRETLEALARRLGERLTARLAHRTVVARCGRAPALSTIRHWLVRYRREYARELRGGAPTDTAGRRQA